MATDEQTEQAVLAVLQRDEHLSPYALDVQVQQQVVTLRGGVDTFASKHAAEHAAYRVHPIKRIVNRIEVHQLGIVEHGDAEIARAAMVKLQSDRYIPADQVAVTVSHGWITLQGEVYYDFQKADAERDVKYLDGVLGVQNLLTVLPEAEAASLLEERQAQKQ